MGDREPNFEMAKTLKDFEYAMINTSDDNAVEMLDRWLRDWLYRRDRCPNCGTSDFED